jgi:hypothetical protein
MSAVELLAKSGEAAKSGPIGLAVILLLCIACYFLFKSLSKHLRTVRERYPQSSQPPQQVDSTDAGQPSAAVQPADDTPADKTSDP